MYGPVSDLVPSGPIFEMFPIGYTMLGGYLERRGYNVRVVNLATVMLRRPRLDMEKVIARLDAHLIGIDLHWLPHCHGAIEVARLVKKHHPHTPIVFGGYSSTYYHRELMGYPEVDFILKGDSTEIPLLQLIETLKSRGTGFSSIPNLSWKDSEGTIYHNPISYVPDNIDHVPLDYGFNIRSVFRFRQLMASLPFDNWLKYPITAMLTCRGCTHGCVTCGASAYACRNSFARQRPAYRHPDMIADECLAVQHKVRAPVFILGDIRQAGAKYADAVVAGLKKRRITNQVAFEFFNPPPLEHIQKLAHSLPHYSAEISLESHEEGVRKAFGKTYTNEAAEESIRHMLRNGCERVDVYFMTGIPKQTAASIRETVDYCRYLYEKFDRDPRLLVFISPMAPFLDPGSKVFENPAEHGYTLSCRTLEEHRQSLLKPSWKHILNYETKWITRDELADATYEAGLGLNNLKGEFGVIDEAVASRTAKRIDSARVAMDTIDEVAMSSNGDLESRLLDLKSKLDVLNISTVCEKRELEWPTEVFKFNPVGILRSLKIPDRKKVERLRQEVQVSPLAFGGLLPTSTVRSIFSEHAPRYDTTNRLLTLGLDRRWRRLAALATGAKEESMVLDGCTGTGDLALALWRFTRCSVVGVDISEQMLERARLKASRAGVNGKIRFKQASVEALPCRDDLYDAVTIGFGIRNTPNHERTLRELLRVTRPGGSIVCLEFAQPEFKLWRKIYLAYLAKLFPLVGRTIARNPVALDYLVSTIMRYPGQSEMVALMKDAGWRRPACRNLVGGALAIYTAQK